MEWLISHQLDIMVYMSGICGILAFSNLVIKSLPRRKKILLALTELSAMLLLLFDRYSYIYRGDISEFGFVMVKFSNGLVYFLSLFMPFMVTQILKDLYLNEGGLEKVPFGLKLCDWMFGAGAVLIIISQFTGLFYTIDEQNYYHRAPTNFLSYLFPLLIVLLQEIIIIKYRARLSRRFVISLILSIALPTIASIVQFFFYGLSLTNICTVFVVIVFYIFMLVELSKALEAARESEHAALLSAKEKESAMFKQTVEALADAIDAKDRYTSGHSTRVAAFSTLIAKEAGFSEDFCEEVHTAALLHDIGKIGVPDRILTKPGKLTDEEFKEIKEHPTRGAQILSSIRMSPELSIGAHYHHERYDGKGYPEGLSGEDIPTAARIIAVADAYDAMTSVRSYRNSLPSYQVKNELIKGMGTQFDPEFARLMLKIIYGSSDYALDDREDTKNLPSSEPVK